jgi:glycine hydroxymethyltransferase
LALLDWKDHGRDYAHEMARSALALANALVRRDVPVFLRDEGITTSHQFAIEAHAYGGGQAAAKLLRRANILTSGIGLPMEPIAGDMNGIRLGTPEAVRWGMTEADMPQLADFIADTLSGARSAEGVARDVKTFRKRFNRLHFIR